MLAKRASAQGDDRRSPDRSNAEPQTRDDGAVPSRVGLAKSGMTSEAQAANSGLAPKPIAAEAEPITKPAKEKADLAAKNTRADEVRAAAQEGSARGRC